MQSPGKCSLGPEMALPLGVHGGPRGAAPGGGEEGGVLGHDVSSVDARTVHVGAVLLVAFFAHHFAPDLVKGEGKS